MNSKDKIWIRPKGQPARSDARALTTALQAGVVWLEAHFKIVNEQNVFPVPDGDTGTNMVLTMRAAVEAVTALPEPRLDEAAAAAAKGALFGARGNSGVILSQFLQGFATALAGQQTLTAVTLAEAVTLGAKSAEVCVARPVEGTLLTVLRATAEAARQQAQAGHSPATLVAGMVAAARQAQLKTPEQLPVLKEAGVTDSGGLGFVYLLEGVWRWLCGEALVPDETFHTGFSTNGHSQAISGPRLDSQEDYGYDVQFLLHGSQEDVSVVRAEMERWGWSVLVVGGADTLKVHLHTPDPAGAIAAATGLGIVDSLVVEDMQHQVRSFTTGVKVGQPASISTIAVVAGAGFVRLFQSLGANYMLSGAKALDITGFLAAIDHVPGRDVVILPNSEAALATAKKAQALSAKRVAVVPSRSMPQGLAALLGNDHCSDLETALGRMTENVEAVRTLVVKPAAAGQPNQVVGVLDGAEAAVRSTSRAVILELLSHINLENFELVTLYFGQDISAEAAADLADEIARFFPKLALELHEGGQPDCYYIVALE